MLRIIRDARLAPPHRSLKVEDRLCAKEKDNSTKFTLSTLRTRQERILGPPDVPTERCSLDTTHERDDLASFLSVETRK
jgi:hypothetical protein